MRAQLVDLTVPNGAVTLAGVETNVEVALEYIEAWLRGQGAVAIHNLMEDAATAEISRSQLWQWVRNESPIADDGTMSAQGYRDVREQAARATRAPTPRPRRSMGRCRRAAGPARAWGVRGFSDDSGVSTDRVGPRGRCVNVPTWRRMGVTNINSEARALTHEWESDPRWAHIDREYAADDVVRLRGSVRVEHTIARRGAERLWEQLNSGSFVKTFGAMTGAQAVEMVRGGLEAIYLSGWQVAADANLAGQTYPDQSLYPSNSVPALVRRLNNALIRADQVEWAEGQTRARVARADRSRRRGRIRWPAARVRAHESDDRGGRGRRALRGPARRGKEVRTHGRQGARSHGAIRENAHRGASRRGRARCTECDRGPHRCARRQPVDERHRRARPAIRDGRSHGRRLLPGDRRNGVGGVARALAYARHADVLWCETSTPNLDEAKQFADAIHDEFPGKLLAYNCSPSFNWEKNLDAHTIAKFQRELAAMGYAFQFITLAGWHLVNLHTFELAKAFAADGMPAYVRLQAKEFARERDGYTGTKHQRESGTGYFDQVLTTITRGTASTEALRGSTEAEQFRPAVSPIVGDAPAPDDDVVSLRISASRDEVDPPPAA